MRIGIDARKLADFGIGTYIRGLLGGLSELGTGDEIVAFVSPGVAAPAGVEAVIVDAPHYSIREIFTVGTAAARAKLDLFHAPHYVVPSTSVPVVVTIHDLIHLHQPMRNPLAPLYARTMIRRAVKKARGVLTVSETVRGQLEAECGARDVVVTPNGIDSRFHPIDVPREPATFLYVGNDKPHKNVEVLVKAFTRIRSERPEARLLLVGAPFERFRQVGGVEIAGFVPDPQLPALYASATALALPSREEGFGLPAAEAMACGTAVITSRAEALVEITGEAALHADTGDPEAFAQAMLRVAGDASLRASLGAKGIERAARYTWRRCAELTRESYERALKR